MRRRQDQRGRLQRRRCSGRSGKRRRSAIGRSRSRCAAAFLPDALALSSRVLTNHAELTATAAAWHHTHAPSLPLAHTACCQIRCQTISLLSCTVTLIRAVDVLQALRDKGQDEMLNTESWRNLENLLSKAGMYTQFLTEQLEKFDEGLQGSAEQVQGPVMQLRHSRGSTVSCNFAYVASPQSMRQGVAFCLPAAVQGVMWFDKPFMSSSLLHIKSVGRTSGACLPDERPITQMCAS